MHPILKLVFGVMFGTILAFCVIVLFESLNTKWFPLEIANPTELERSLAIQHSPIQSYLIVIVGFMVSSFMGAYLASRCAAQSQKLWAGLAVGFILLLCGIFFFILYPYPIWVAAVTSVAFLPLAYLGGKMAIR